MLGFITVPNNYVANIGGVASTIIGDMTVPVALVIGLFLAIWLSGYAVDLFHDMRREARIAKLAHDLGKTPAEIKAEEKALSLQAEARELHALELEEAEEHYI